MNKEHQEIAIKFINVLKENAGLMTGVDVDKHPIKMLFDFKTDLIVIDGLSDLGLIDKSRKGVFRLTDKGWHFKSFERLYRDEKIKLIGTKTTIIIAILTFLINLFQIIFSLMQ